MGYEIDTPQFFGMIQVCMLSNSAIYTVQLLFYWPNDMFSLVNLWSLEITIYLTSFTSQNKQLLLPSPSHSIDIEGKNIHHSSLRLLSSSVISPCLPVLFFCSSMTISWPTGKTLISWSPWRSWRRSTWKGIQSGVMPPILLVHAPIIDGRSCSLSHG